MIKISKLADYAVVVLEALVADEKGNLSSSVIAQTTKLPEPTVAKVLKLLARGGVVTSVRGAMGGYGLARAASDITVYDVICAVDGPIALTACVGGNEPDCGVFGSCTMKGRWDDVNQAILNALCDVTLADMVGKAYKCAAIKPEKLREGAVHGGY